MFNNIYNIDFNRWLIQTLPTRRRKRATVQWLLCLIFPVVELYNVFLQYRASSNYKLDHTPQVFSMEDAINDSFDRAQRRIYIKNGEYIFPVWFYDRSSNKPVYFFERASDTKVRFYDRSTFDRLEVDFEVVMPKTMNLTDAETIRLKALVDFYRLPDKTYILSYE